MATRPAGVPDIPPVGRHFRAETSIQTARFGYACILDSGFPSLRMGNAGMSGIQRHTSERMKKKKTGPRARLHLPRKAVKKESVFVRARHLGPTLVTFARVFLGGRGSRPPLAPPVCVFRPHGGRDSAVHPANLWSLRRHLWLVRDPRDPSGRLRPPPQAKLRDLSSA